MAHSPRPSGWQETFGLLLRDVHARSRWWGGVAGIAASSDPTDTGGTPLFGVSGADDRLLTPWDIGLFSRRHDFSPKPAFTTVCWGDRGFLSPCKANGPVPSVAAATSTAPPLSSSLCSTRASSGDTRVACSRPVRSVPPGHTLGSACPQAAAAGGAPL